MPNARFLTIVTSTLVLFGSALVVAFSAARSADAWWSPGDGRVLPATVAYENPSGRLSILNTAGRIETKGNAFFEPIGENGRACVTCHQPADAMSISVETIQQRWQATNGKDPLFAAIDGKNCPDLPDADPKSHSLLLSRGLIRVFLPWPPKAVDGSAVKPEFTIEVVRDPTGCNTSSVYGLNSPSPTVSVYRRPRPVANLKYVTADGFGVSRFIAKNGQPTARDPGNRKACPDEHDGRCARTEPQDAGPVGRAGHLQVEGRAQRCAARADHRVRKPDLCRRKLSQRCR